LRSGELLNAQFALAQKNTVPLANLHPGHFWKKYGLPGRDLGKDSVARAVAGLY